MFGSFAGWLLSVILAFFAGVNAGNEKQVDSELQQKIQGHVDVIVDETAGIVDDVAEELRKDEQVQQVEKFVNDVDEIAQNTAKDIEAHFGSDDQEEVTEKDAGTAAETENVTENVTETENAGEPV